MYRNISRIHSLEMEKIAMKEVRVAMIGYGGIARSHNHGYRKLVEEGEPVRLVAVCDINEDQFKNQIGINIDTGATGLPADIHTYTDVDELLANEEFDMADICLPSFLHSKFAIKMLQAGKHVLSEKPMALSSQDCDAMIAAAKEANRKLMIGMCLRFDECYLYLKDCIDSGKYGNLTHLFMERLSAIPAWSFENWFQDTQRSGGCILDMHIHDIDMVRFLLGEPKAVSTIALDQKVRWQVENTRMYYDGKIVTINGSWSESPTTRFTAGFRAGFEKATVISNCETVTVYPNEGDPFTMEFPENHGIRVEIRTFIRQLMAGQIENGQNSPESARETVRVIEKMRESAALDGAIIKL